MELFKAHAFEAFIGSIMAIVPFFLKRTISNFDRRVGNTEKSHKLILDKLHKIDKEVTKVSTKVDMISQNRG
jgi:hypothetical protein